MPDFEAVLMLVALLEDCISPKKSTALKKQEREIGSTAARTNYKEDIAVSMTSLSSVHCW